MRTEPIIIAIDGPAASGKGTLALKIACYYNLPHLDTGLLYRAVAKIVIESGQSLEDEAAAVEAAQKVNADVLSSPDLRDRAMGEAASLVATHPGVRAALIEYQRQFAINPAGAVLDGRDIGTVICPDADVKLYVTASVEERARRRFKELSSKGAIASYDDILADLKKRDERDSKRSNAPLKVAEDAIVLDTTHLDPNEALAAALSILDEKAME